MKKVFGKISLKAVVITALVLAVLLSTGIIAANYLPENDPLVTLSYLNEKIIPELKAELSGAVSAAGASNAGYTVVELKCGQILKAAGSVEIILRRGSSAVALSPFDNVGISDLSNCAEILSGGDIPVNAYCLIPRGDGRGVCATSDVAYIMVRGDYTVE